MICHLMYMTILNGTQICTQNIHVQPFMGPRSPILCLPLLGQYRCVNSNSSCETAHLRSLTRTSTVCISVKPLSPDATTQTSWPTRSITINFTINHVSDKITQWGVGRRSTICTITIATAFIWKTITNNLWYGKYRSRSCDVHPLFSDA